MSSNKGVRLCPFTAYAKHLRFSMMSLDMARYYLELLLMGAAAISCVWFATRSHVWWRRLLYIVVSELSLFLLTFSGCSGMSNFPGQTRPVSAIRNLSVSELRWSFGLMFAAAACLTLVRYMQNVSQPWLALGKIAIYGFVSLAGFFIWLQGCDEGSTRLFPIIYAPGGRCFARVQELDGGAMDSFHTVVMLRTSDRLIGRQIFGSQDAPDEVHLTWVDATHLKVDYDQWIRDGVALPDDDFSCNGALGVSVNCVPHVLEQK